MRIGLVAFAMLALLLAGPAAAQEQPRQRTIDVVGDASVTARNDTARVVLGARLRLG